MSRIKRLLSMVLVAVFTLMTSLSNAPVSAAVKKTTAKSPAIPKVRFVNQPKTEYTAGDVVRFDLDSAGYAGKVQYRVILWNDQTKSYKDLWTTGDRYYANWKPSGNTLFNLHWIINEPGNYRITILAKRADIPNSKTALKGQNADSYIAGVPFVVKAKDTAVLLNKEGSTYGSADPKKPVSVKGDVKVLAKAVTYKNASVDGNLYISADNAAINNVSVTGTVFVDPGKDGNATLENVTAKEVKVLSGGENSIYLKSVNTDSLVVESTSKVRVETTGTTKVGRTEVTSYAVLDSKGGSLGTITVAKSESGKVEVEFRGTFTEPIVVQAEATIKAAADANIAKVEVAPEKGEAVKLEGAFKAVEVTKEAKVEIAADAKITEALKVTAKAEVKADAKSDVAKVELAPENKDAAIKLEGAFKTVEITKEAKVELGAGTTVQEVQAKANSDIKLANDAKIEEVKKDQDVQTTTEGGTVSKETVVEPTTPTTPPTSGGGGGTTPSVSITAISNISIKTGDENAKTITVETTPSTANITAVSSDQAVATVSLTGKDITVKGINKGTATITVTASKSGYYSKTETFDVVVSDLYIKNIENIAEVDNENNTIQLKSLSGVSSSKLYASKNTNLKISVKTADDATYLLGTWQLFAGDEGNQIVSVNNFISLDLTKTLEALKASKVSSDDIAEAVDFTKILNAVKDDPNKSFIYDTVFSAISQIENPQEVYDAINLPVLYAAADADTKKAIEDAFKLAVDECNEAGDHEDILFSALVGENSAETLDMINTSDCKNVFYENINFTALWSAIVNSDSKKEIYDAINFTAIFNAVKSNIPSDKVVTIAQDVYNNLQKLDPTTKAAITSSIDTSSLVYSLIEVQGNTITFTLTEIVDETNRTIYTLIPSILIL